jgi:hypothetical protein
MSFNIDIHCHSSSKPFMSGIDQQIKTAFETYDFDIDHPIYNLLRSQLAKFSKVLLKTQSNFGNLYKGGVRVAFVSLTPMERGFTAMNPKPVSFFKTIKKDLLEEASGYGIQFLSSAAINALTGYSKNDNNIVKRALGSIYEELFLKEINYLLRQANYRDQICTIRFPKNYAELAANLNDDHILNILVNIEGAHSFGSFRLLPDLIGGVSNTHSQYDGNVFTGSEICSNLKAYRTNAQYPRIFSIGICHHFWNGLAGHARSLNGLIADVVSQNEGINSGLQASGKMVIDAMALTDYDGEKSINLCREDLVEIYHAKGIIGIQLDEKRIMGPLALEELNKKHKAGDEDQLKYVYAKTIWANIFCVIDEIKEAGVADLRKAWDMICIGSDFDGLINHLACFESAAKMEALKYTMGYFLEEPQGIPLYYKDAQNQYTLSIEKMEQLKAGYSNHALIDKIFNQNAMQFLRDNF